MFENETTNFPRLAGKTDELNIVRDMYCYVFTYFIPLSEKFIRSLYVCTVR